MTATSHLASLIDRGLFAVTAELGPPRSADPRVVAQKCDVLRGAVDAVNITDNQTAIVRMSSIAAARIVKDAGLEPVAQMTCRDRNRIALQSDILGAAALGIPNLLVLSGDHQRFGNHPQAKNVFDVDSVQLLTIARTLRDDRLFQCGDSISTSGKAPGLAPDLFLGAAANPCAEPMLARVLRVEKKIAAGAQFIQTQAVFDVPAFERWMELVRSRGAHQRAAIMAGIVPVRSAKALRYMAEQVPGMRVPPPLIARMEGAADPAREGATIAVELIEQLRRIDGVRGLHIMAIEWERIVPRIVERAGLLPRPA